MGVAGCGKSTLGRLLASRLALPFIEGDDAHPPANIAKMRAGTPLDDADRLPWLQTLQTHLAAARANGNGLVLTCSALKRQYRDLLREGDPDLVFLHLHGDADILAHRLAARPGHFMPAVLLSSQLHDLETPSADENCLHLDCACTPEQLMEQIFRTLGEQN